MSANRLCRGCLAPLPSWRWVWCSARCERFVQKHPHDFLRIFRWCKQCEVEIDHLSPHVRYCSSPCRRRAGAVRAGKVRAEPLSPRICALDGCGSEFTPQRLYQRCCSEKHGKALWNRQSRADGRQPPEPWTDARRDRYHRRRALKKAASTGEPVRFSEIAERDNWQCSLCLEPVDPAVAWPDSLSPSLDHRIPLTRHGAHDPSNVFLAHLGCNSSKGDRLLDDGPLLIG